MYQCHMSSLIFLSCILNELKERFYLFREILPFTELSLLVRAFRDGCHAVDRVNYSLVTQWINKRKVTVMSDVYFVLVYFQMEYGLLLYFKLARVVMGNVSEKGENNEKYYYLKCFFTRWFLTELCLFIPNRCSVSFLILNFVCLRVMTWFSSCASCVTLF